MPCSADLWLVWTRDQRVTRVSAVSCGSRASALVHNRFYPRNQRRNKRGHGASFDCRRDDGPQIRDGGENPVGLAGYRLRVAPGAGTAKASQGRTHDPFPLRQMRIDRFPLFGQGDRRVGFCCFDERDRLFSRRGHGVVGAEGTGRSEEVVPQVADKSRQRVQAVHWRPVAAPGLLELDAIGDLAKLVVQAMRQLSRPMAGIHPPLADMSDNVHQRDRHAVPPELRQLAQHLVNATDVPPRRPGRRERCPRAENQVQNRFSLSFRSIGFAERHQSRR